MLKISIKTFENVATLCLRGPVVVGEVRPLRMMIETLPKIATLLLDLTRVTMIDAAGLGVLLELREKTKVNGTELRLLNPTERVNRVFEITRLNTVFEITAISVMSVNRINQAVALRDFARCA